MFIRIHLLLAHIALTRLDHVQCLNTLAMIEGNPDLLKREHFYIQCYKAEAYCRQGSPKIVRNAEFVGDEVAEREANCNSEFRERAAFASEFYESVHLLRMDEFLLNQRTQLPFSCHYGGQPR